MLLLIQTYAWNLWPKRKGIRAEEPSTVKKVWWQPFNIRHYHRVSPCAHCQMRCWFLYRPWVRCVKNDGSCNVPTRWSLSWRTLTRLHVWISKSPLWIHGKCHDGRRGGTIISFRIFGRRSFVGKAAFPLLSGAVMKLWRLPMHTWVETRRVWSGSLKMEWISWGSQWTTCFWVTSMTRIQL